MVLFVALISPEIIKIIGTADYQIAVYVIPVVTLGVYYTFVYDLYASIEFYFGATKYVMYASVTGALLNIVLNAIFIPKYGFIAAAYTTLVCYFIFMIVHYLFSKKVLRQQQIEDPIYDNKMVFFLSGLLTLVGLGCMLVFPYTIIRVLLMVGLLMACVIKRKTIMGMFSFMKK